VAAPSPSPSASPPRVALAVYDVMGRRIRTLLDEDLPDGVHEIRWDGRDGEGREASSGIYFYRLGIGGVHEVRRTLLLR
jgi:flagellar hook assembly protein FlgD